MQTSLPPLRVALSAGLLTWAGAGCMQVSTGPNDPTGSSTPASTATAATAQDAGPPATGVNCGTDPQTGTVLCSAVSSCTSLSVDPSAWPSCGFRVTGGASLDLECLCGDSLCAIGVATSCDQASTLLSGQNQLMVCAEVAEQRCVALTPVTPAAPADAGGVPSTCDRNCLVGCGTAPDCLQLCGC
jgi:hypothetical protein